MIHGEFRHKFIDFELSESLFTDLFFNKTGERSNSKMRSVCIPSSFSFSLLKDEKRANLGVHTIINMGWEEFYLEMS